MKPTMPSGLPCAVFGHNYVVNDFSKGPSNYECKHCGQPFEVDKNGDIVEHSLPNKAIQNTLRQLFHMKLRTTRLSLRH